MNAIDLRDRSAVITGAARGIGFACAKRFLQSGAVVTIWDKDQAAVAKAIEELKTFGTVHSALVDVTDEAAVAAATRRTEELAGRIDILINNAGISGPNKLSWDYQPAEWRNVLEVDLTSAYLCCRAVVPAMRQRQYGRIVNMASIAGKEGNPNAAAYSAAKAGLIGLTKSLGKELAGSGVIVNCVTPAVAKTDLFAQMTEAHIAYMLSKIPMNRFVEVDEIAALVAWLSSADCSFTTGAVFDISGGRATY
jgi:3-oxoacyl-[acyl-carrier protein] reductase